MKKIVCIVGPTAVGKTNLAFSLAQKFNGALVSADSVQVFRELEIVSGKDIPPESVYEDLPQLSKDGYHSGFYTYHNIPIFLLDVVVPTSSFSVSQFQELAENTIDYIYGKEMIPIIVGGTGLYVSALLKNIGTAHIEPDLELRRELEEFDVEKLQEMLRNLNFEKFYSMNDSDKHNKRRLVRAIEISTSKNNKKIVKNKKYESFVIGLTCERELLKKRIDERIYERLNQGALEEAKSLFLKYENLSQQVKDANGYKQLFQFLQKKISWEEAVYRWKISEYRHAKNQMTWFRKYGNAMWFDITKKGFEKEIEISLKKFLKQVL